MAESSVSDSSLKYWNAHLNDMVTALDIRHNKSDGILVANKIDWPKSFQLYAFIVQIVMGTRSQFQTADYCRYKIDKRSLPKQVAFTSLSYKHYKKKLTMNDFSVEKYEKIEFAQVHSEEQMIKFVKIGGGVELDTSETVKNDEWQKMIDFISESQYFKTDVTDWRPRNSRVSDYPFPKTLRLYSGIHRALTHGMASGAAKGCIAKVMEYIKKIGNLKEEIEIDQPTVSDTLNGRVQLVSDPKYFDKFSIKITKNENTYTEESSNIEEWIMPSDPRSIHHPPTREVSDILVYKLLEIGQFLLCIECKKDKDDFEKAKTKNMRQCLTHLHFQDYTFGIVISATKFCIMFLFKRRGKISVVQYEEVFSKADIAFENDIPHIYNNLLVNKFIKVFDWMLWIMRLGDKQNFLYRSLS